MKHTIRKKELAFGDNVLVIRNGEILKSGLSVYILNIDLSNPFEKFYYCYSKEHEKGEFMYDTQLSLIYN